MPLTSKEIRTLLTEKAPPRDDQQKVQASILIALAERVDKLDMQVAELLKAAGMLAELLAKQGGIATAPEMPEAATDAAAADPQRDNTPFPAGVKSEGALGAVQAPPPAPANVAGGNKAVNPSPIPTKATPNGSKTA